ncbi:MAG TPA: hypothetical protein VI894_02820, partial [Candidatus Nanoarchaeia archaeon]|nr:hypothetical protein [Candidatus Nanoarchaeia archaeon]
VTIRNSTTNLVNMTVQSGPNYNWTGTVSSICPGVTQAQCQLVFNATDNAGNWNDSITLNLTIDDVVPAVRFQNTNLTVAGNKTKSSWRINFSVNVTDLTAIVSATFINGSGTPVSTLLNTNTNIYYIANTTAELCPGINNGNCTFTFMAADNASNSNSTTNITITVDDVVPVVTNFTYNYSTIFSLTSPINFTVNVLDANINTIALMNQSGHASYMARFSSDSDLWYSVNASRDFGITNDGNYTFRVNATDQTGNWNDSAFLSVLIDLQAPIVNSTPTLSPNPIRNGEVLHITSFFTDNYNVSAANVTLNNTEYAITLSSNGQNATGTVDILISNFNEGTHTLRIRARDQNRWGDYTTVTFSVNNSALTPDYLSMLTNATPKVTYAFPSYGTLNYSTISLNITTDKNATCKFGTTDTTYGNLTTGFTSNGRLHNATVTSSEGLNVYFVRCSATEGVIIGANMTESKIIIFNVDTSTTFSGWITPLYGGGSIGWRFFYAPRTFLNVVNLSSNYNVSRVLQNINTSYNLLYYYNSSIGGSAGWKVHRPSNISLSEFTEFNDDGANQYWINMTNTSITQIRIN